MKTNAALPVLLWLTFALLLASCGDSVNTNTAVHPSPTRLGSNDSKLPYTTPTPTPTASPTATPSAPDWLADVKYYFLTIGDKTYHGTKFSETELKTCTGQKIPVALGELEPTDVPCSDYNLKGRKVSKEDDHKIEAENEPCPSGGGDDVKAEEGPDVAKLIDFAKAIEEELIDAQPEGQGLHYLKLTLSLKINEPLYVRIPPGTVFFPETRIRSSGDKPSQRMISVEPTIKRLDVPGREVCVSVPVACLDIELGVPGRGEGYTLGDVSAFPQSSSLRRLVNNPEFLREGWLVKQYALWIVRSNPPRTHEFGGVPNSHLKRVRTLLRQAGLRTDQFVIFAELD